MYYTQNVLPTADIAVRRNKVKSYANTVYLQDKQEFEIELFNPTQTTKLAKISINGKLISAAGIVIKPGQRIYLERYLDSPKKFLFETYVVDGSAETQSAIQNNGNIKIDFYDEYIPVSTVTYTTNFFNTNTAGSNNLYNGTVILKILPLSEKPVEAKDLSVYCTNCGTKNKKGNYKFCPKCGTKY